MAQLERVIIVCTSEVALVTRTCRKEYDDVIMSTAQRVALAIFHCVCNSVE